MKIMFMGTPEFAAEILDALVAAGHEVGLVISQPDRPRNRGKKLQPTPVKEKALTYGIEVLQPERIKDNAKLLAIVKNYNPDLTVVAAYGKIIPAEYLDLPKYGTVNVHASLLPKYRGASPIQSAILAGDEVTGVTIMYVEKTLDTGAMIAKAKTPIAQKTCGELMAELAKLGGELLARSMENIQSWKEEAIPQDEQLATYAGIIAKKDGEIDFRGRPEQIERAIRAFNPWPGAYTYLNGEPFKIWRAEVLNKQSDREPGEITAVTKDAIEVAAGSGTLSIKEVQLPGKKRNTAAEFIRGYQLREATKFGENHED